MNEKNFFMIYYVIISIYLWIILYFILFYFIIFYRIVLYYNIQIY